jgi:hypothetical protein|tara:strand:- start:251 stop:673 length:423 start_codon:yes stop_codon:yes gene_type:complete
MALPNSGGGYQVGDGNLNEIDLYATASQQTATATATLTVAQITGNLLVGNPTTTAATYTLPTATAIDAVITNAKIGSTFNLTVINLGTSTGLITMAVGTGITAVGNLVVAITGSAAGVGGAAQFMFRKTGDAAYTLYRIA